MLNTEGSLDEVRHREEHCSGSTPTAKIRERHLEHRKPEPLVSARGTALTRLVRALSPATKAKVFTSNLWR